MSTKCNFISLIKLRYNVELSEEDLQKIRIGINCGMCYFLSNPNDLSVSGIEVIVKFAKNLFKFVAERDGTIITVLPFSHSKNADMLNIPDLKKEIKLLDKNELKALSHICAYCNKPLKHNEKTVDHILPKSAEGKNVIENYVICCSECNNKKANYNINSYLEANEDIAQCFENYLEMIDNQKHNKEYSRAIKRHIKSHIFSKAKNYKVRQKKQVEETQTIEYKIENTDLSFKLNTIQSKILDYYLSDKEFTDYKSLAKELKISKSQLVANITQINCLTGIFVLKEVGKNGIRLNKVYSEILKPQRV